MTAYLHGCFNLIECAQLSLNRKWACNNYKSHPVLQAFHSMMHAWNANCYDKSATVKKVSLDMWLTSRTMDLKVSGSLM